MSIKHALEPAACAVLAAHIATTDGTTEKWARRHQIPSRTVRSWLAGTVPRADSANHLERLTDGVVRVAYWGERARE